MINWGQIITTMIFVAGTFVSIVYGIYFARLWVQKLPEHTRLALEQFARQAVLQVEQTHEELSGNAKKQLAVTAVMKLFAAFGLPAPPMGAIDIAIEAAVFVLSHLATIESNNPSTPRVEKPTQG